MLLLCADYIDAIATQYSMVEMNCFVSSNLMKLLFFVFFENSITFACLFFSVNRKFK